MSSCPNTGAAGAGSSPVPGSGWVLRVLAQPFLRPLFGERGQKGLVLLSLLSSIPQRISWYWRMLQNGTKASVGEHPSAPCLLPSVCSSLAASQQVPGVRVCPSRGSPSVPASCHLAGVPISAGGSLAPSRSPSQPCRCPGESEPAWFVRRGYAVLGSLCAVWCELCRKTTTKNNKIHKNPPPACVCELQPGFRGEGATELPAGRDKRMAKATLAPPPHPERAGGDHHVLEKRPPAVLWVHQLPSFG